MVLIVAGCFVAACSRTALLDPGDQDFRFDDAQGSTVNARGDGGLNGPEASDASLGDAGLDIRTACLEKHDVFVTAFEGSTPSVNDGEAEPFFVSVVNTIDGLPADVRIDTYGDEWSAEFSSFSMGAALNTGLYENPERAGFTDPGRAGLDIEGRGTDFGSIGEFEILSLKTSRAEGGLSDEPVIDDMTVVFSVSTFEGPLVGCVHVNL